MLYDPIVISLSLSLSLSFSLSISLCLCLSLSQSLSFSLSLSLCLYLSYLISFQVGFSQLALLEQTLMLEAENTTNSPVPGRPPSPPRTMAALRAHNLESILETSIGSYSGPSDYYSPPNEKAEVCNNLDSCLLLLPYPLFCTHNSVLDTPFLIFRVRIVFI